MSSENVLSVRSAMSMAGITCAFKPAKFTGRNYMTPEQFTKFERLLEDNLHAIGARKAAGPVVTEGEYVEFVVDVDVAGVNCDFARFDAPLTYVVLRARLAHAEFAVIRTYFQMGGFDIELKEPGAK